MFGGVAAKVNGLMFAGLFARGAVAKLSASDQQVALAIDGASMFDPMGNGRIMRDTVFLPESVLEEPSAPRVATEGVRATRGCSPGAQGGACYQVPAPQSAGRRDEA